MTLLKEFMMMQTGISSAELNFRSQMFLVDPDGAALNRLIDELEQKGYWSQTMDNEKIASRLLKYVQRTIDYRSNLDRGVFRWRINFCLLLFSSRRIGKSLGAPFVQW